MENLSANQRYKQSGSDLEVPVAAGRETARLIGVAALDLQLRRIGYDMADEFNKRILEQMNEAL